MTLGLHKMAFRRSHGEILNHESLLSICFRGLLDNTYFEVV